MLACGAAAPPPHLASPPPAAAMLGCWQYVAPALPAAGRPVLGAGLIIVLHVDSAAAQSFSGRVVTWFAGDMGVATDNFGRLRGELSEDGAAHISIPPARGTAAPVSLSGMLRGDTLTITEASFFTPAGAAFVRRAHEN